MKELMKRSEGRFVHIHLPHENVAGKIVAAHPEYVEIAGTCGDTVFVNCSQIVYLRFDKGWELEARDQLAR